MITYKVTYKEKTPIYVGATLPKIGDNGIAIHAHHRIADWEFSKEVAKAMQKNEITEAWFQVFTSKGWQWSHGIVSLQNGKAVITQIG